MRYLKIILILSLSGIFLLPSIAVSRQRKDMNHYVRQYSQVKITSKQNRRLSKYDHLIEYFSSFAFFKPKHKVNPDFIRALILAESSVEPRAVSKKNAKGLAQIIYATGKIAAKEITKKQISFRYVSRSQLLKLKPEDLYNPAINILLACYLVSKYNHSYQGKLELVISAWNAGENSIVNNRPPQYHETLNLIGKVNGYFIYLLKEKKRFRRYIYQKS